MEPRLDTFPRLLLHHAAVRGDHPAVREKDLGIWQTWTWREAAAEVRSLACGLAAQGFRRGMHLAIIGDNRPRLYWAMAAAQALGGVPVPMYQDAPAADFVYVLNDAEIAYAVVEDQEQVDKMQEAMAEVPTLRHIYFDDERGMRNYEGVLSFAMLQEQGREFDRANPGYFDAEVAKGAAEDVSVMLYTSGTTGRAEGRLPDAPRVHRVGPGRRRVRSPHRRRQHPVVPADGLGRRPPVLLRAELRRGLHHQLPGVGRHGDDRPARDRPHLLLRAAAGVREPAHAGDDPDGGRERDQARRVPLLHGRRPPLRRRDPRRQAGRRGRPSAVRARQHPRLRTAAQRAGDEQDPRRLHRRRGDRSRPVPLLPLDRHQPEAALRLRPRPAPTSACSPTAA